MVAAYYPGIDQVIDCTYTLSHGITPGIAMLTVAPQSQWPDRTGTLTLDDGNGGVVEFHDMIIDRASFQLNSSGQIIRLSLLDRRWKWRYGHIRGHYNLRSARENPNGSTPREIFQVKVPKDLDRHVSDPEVIDPSTEAKPQELATKLLQAMGERNFNVGLLPNNTRPEVLWDYDNPAKELARMCDELGCRVVLQLDGSVAIWPIGQGPALPTPPNVLSDSQGVDLAERPDSITVVGGPTRFQIDVLLEAVGLDRADTPKPLDELSYKPKAGWEFTNPETFNSVVDPRDRELALQSVFRWYRIPVFPKGVDGKDLEVPGYGKVKSRIQILPIETERVQRDTLIDEFGFPYLKNRPALVWGFFATQKLGEATNLDPDTDKVPDALLPDPDDPDPNFPPGPGRGTSPEVPYTIDTRQGIVRFSRPMIIWEKQANGKYRLKPAILGLRCATSIRNLFTREPERYTRTFFFPGPKLGTGTMLLRHADLVLNQEPAEYPPNTLKATETKTNKHFLDQEADYYLQHAAAEFQTPASRTVNYAGIVPISPNGRIVQVQWQVGPSGAVTFASESDEFSITTIPYWERRFFEKQELDRQQKMLQKQRQIGFAD